MSTGASTGLERSPIHGMASMYISITDRHRRFLELCHFGVKEKDVIAACREDLGILEEKDQNGEGVLALAGKRGFTNLIDYVYEQKRALFSEENPELLNALREALLSSNECVADRIVAYSPSIVSWRDEQGDTCLLWACRECKELVGREVFIRIVEWCLSNASPEELQRQRHFETGETPFVIACKIGSLDLVTKLYWKYSAIKSADQMMTENVSGETPLLVALRHPHGWEIVQFLFQVGVPIQTEEEMRGLVDLLPRFRERSIRGVYTKSSHFLFIPYVDKIGKFLSLKEEEELLELMSCLPQLQYAPQAIPGSFTVEERITSYNVMIPDVSEIADPYDSLNGLFNHLSEQDYLENMNLGLRGEDLKSLEAAKEEKALQFNLVGKLFDAIKTKKPDRSIPKGRELFYYQHLESILKHLARFLELKRQERMHFKAECFSYLAMLTESSESCYPNYATVLHKVYGSLTGEEHFIAMWSTQEIGWRKFLEELKHFYVEERVKIATGYCQGRDTHVIAVLQQMLDETGIPYRVERVVDSQQHLIAALLTIRREVLGLPSEGDYLMQYREDQENYDAVKTLFLESFHREVTSIGFVYRGLQAFLLKNLNEAASGDFLADLYEWLDLELQVEGQESLIKISREVLLDFDIEQGVYTLKAEGMYLLLVKLSKFFRGNIDLQM
jgi:hypothetical protein